MIARIMEVGVSRSGGGVLLLIGFIYGYGVRELISRSRRANAERRHFERPREEITQTPKLIPARPEDRLAICFKSGDRGVPPEGERHDNCCSCPTPA
jgi:hypothetical protein